MITYKFHGGLCNSILQIYSLFRFCKDNNINEDKIKIDMYSDRCFRVAKNKFSIEKPFIINYDYFGNIKHHFYNSNVIKLEQSLVKHNQIKFETTDRFSYNLKDNIIFTGYSFFSNYTIRNDKNTFLKLFYNKELYSNYLLQYRDILKDRIAIHCRRSDFQYIDYEKYILKDDYIENILKDNNCIIFSDSIDYYKEKFSNKYDVMFSENKKPFEDLYLMSMCKQIYITSNSTFSKVSRLMHELFPK